MHSALQTIRSISVYVSSTHAYAGFSFNQVNKFYNALFLLSKVKLQTHSITTLLNGIWLLWVHLYCHRVTPFSSDAVTTSPKECRLSRHFWAPAPEGLIKDPNNTNDINMMISVLHHFIADNDLSFISRQNCGHMLLSIYEVL